MIKSGRLKENQKLPTENELSKQFNISKAPVRQTLSELANGNYIYKVQGKGSFVSPKYIKQPLGKLKSFTNEIRELGYKPGAKLIQQRVMVSDSEISTKLDIDTDDEVLEVTRVRYIDDEIFSLNYSYFPIRRLPEIRECDFNSISIYVLFEEKLGYEITSANQTLEVTAANSKIAELLNRDINSPLLLMKRTTFARKNLKEVPVEFVKVYFLPDKYKFEIQLNK
jgi:GntR family transcriptional regulator